MNEQEINYTPKGKSYWAGNANYSKTILAIGDEFDSKEDWKQYIHHYMVNCFGILLYEFGNNGNCNVTDAEVREYECDDCDGTGQDDFGDVCDECKGSGVDKFSYGGTINKQYREPLDWIWSMLANESMGGAIPPIKKLMESGMSNPNDPEEMRLYTRLGDAIGYYIENTTNRYRAINE